MCLPLQDMFRLYTPGGGGYGREEDTHRRPQSKRRRLNETFPERGSVYEYRMAQEGVWKQLRKRGRKLTDKSEEEKKEDRGGDITGSQAEWEMGNKEWGSVTRWDSTIILPWEIKEAHAKVRGENVWHLDVG